MMESTSKISKEVQRRVKEIAAMGGDSKRKIDTDEEYKELSNLLAGQSGANAKFVQEKMTEYENYLKEQQEKAFLDKVSDAVKKFVNDVKASFGDDDKIDSDEEAERLQRMLPNTNGDLSDEDLEYIRRALTEGGYSVNVSKPKTTDNTTGGIKPMEPKDAVPVDSDEPKKPSTDTSTSETTGTNKPDKPSKPNKPNKSKRVTIGPTPQPQPQPKQPKVLERDAVDGTTRGRKFAEEITSRIVNNGELARQLKGVNSKNAYDFFQQYKAENNGRQNIVYKTLVKTSDIRDNLNYRNFLAPINSLLIQAKSYGLEKSSAYRSLERIFKDMTRTIATPNANMDPTVTKAQAIDRAIDALLTEMGRVVH